MRATSGIQALLIAGLLGTGSATAATFTLFHDGASARPAGATYTSVFDANLLFVAGVERVASATLTLHFVPTESLTLDSVIQVPTFTGFAQVGALTVPWDAIDTTSNYSNPLDSARVLIDRAGGQQAAGSNLSNFLSTDVFTGERIPDTAAGDRAVVDLIYSSGKGNGLTPLGQTVHDLYGFSRDYTHTEGYAGSFSVIAALNADSLASLSSAGYVRFGYTVTSGNLAMASAELILTAVPEPRAYVLMLVGLVVTGAALRFRGIRVADAGDPS